MNNDITVEEIDQVMQNAWGAFKTYRKSSLKTRAGFMRAIAAEIENLGEALIDTAMTETHLPAARLRNERTRTIYQLNAYADACEKGDWLEIRIDRIASKPDIRKMLCPLGPVLVFGAANFPFAYSTAGGDTACALAAGCPVIVKAHPAHAETSEMVAGAILKAARNTSMPMGVFTHVHGVTHGTGKALIEHPLLKAVGFTGSLAGGRQLFDWACQRKEPIPVFAEMSSINPVFLLPGKLAESSAELAEMLGPSITLGIGQFCTNPGLIIAIDNKHLEDFADKLSEIIRKTTPAEMLNPGIFKNYVERRANAIAQEQVEMIAVSETDPQLNEGAATITTTTAESFIHNPILHQEVFGPYSLIIKCRDVEEMLAVAVHLEGQLTSTLMGTMQDIHDLPELVDVIKNNCGRFILNSVPTGVEVCLSMQHGGPYPATTDSRFTSVGADGIKRFARPVAFQNWPNELLPEELKDENPLGIWRSVNNTPER
jgi:NADP-dependent aldehyde dehydrogenase